MRILCVMEHFPMGKWRASRCYVISNHFFCFLHDEYITSHHIEKTEAGLKASISEK